MKCDICNTEAASGSIIMGQGFCCSEDCSQIAQGRRKAMLDELLAEPVGQMPDALDTHDFERWSLKFAAHFLKGLSPKDKKRLPAILQSPEHLALHFKERIIAHLHKSYVSETENRGHARMFSSATYCFRQPVPATAIVDACRKAQLIT